MGILNDCFKLAELELASYAELTATIPDFQAMKDAGMTEKQAARFAQQE